MNMKKKINKDKKSKINFIDFYFVNQHVCNFSKCFKSFFNWLLFDSILIIPNNTKFIFKFILKIKSSL